MESEKNLLFLEFKDLIINRANNMLYCFDGTLATFKDNTNRYFFYTQTFSAIYTIKCFSEVIEFKANFDGIHNRENIYNAVKQGSINVNYRVLN